MRFERTIYVDESFFRWPGLASKEVNIAYGAASIPNHSLGDTKKRWKAFEKLVRSLTLRDTGITLDATKEIKATDTNKLEAISRHEIGKFWAAFFAKHHIRIYGFYAMAEGFGNYNLRNDAFDKAPDEFEEVIDNQEALYAEWLLSTENRRQKMKGEGKGELGLLENIIRPFISCFLHHHLDTKERQPFRIIWDHRSGEDEGLRDIVADMVEKVRIKIGMSQTDLSRSYHGLDICHSHKVIGLRYADVVAGAFRNLFRSYPELLTDNAKFEIKSAKYNVDMLSPTLPFYKRPMNEALAASILLNTQKIVFPHLIPSLGRGIFSYMTKFGDARSCLISEKTYFDMAD